MTKRPVDTRVVVGDANRKFAIIGLRRPSDKGDPLIDLGYLVRAHAWAVIGYESEHVYLCKYTGKNLVLPEFKTIEVAQLLVGESKYAEAREAVGPWRPLRTVQIGYRTSSGFHVPPLDELEKRFINIRPFE